ncbi:MAG TPA: hypothetical protein VFC07_12020 [Verrucomicrobiae bacterium]|nr:hypothetical protein [Verrucomicrobiae bacterium]
MRKKRWHKTAVYCILAPEKFTGMIWFKRDKEKERFYLLPGMGGKAMRKKNKIFLAWSIFAAVIVSFALALTLVLLNVH